MPEGTICKLPALICTGNSSFQSTFPSSTENTTVLGLVKIKFNTKCPVGVNLDAIDLFRF